MKDILDIFEFKKEDFNNNEVDAIISMLSKDEKKVFNLLKFSDDALTATQVYDYYIDKIVNEDPSLKNKIEDLKKHLGIKNKKPHEIKADFARKNNVKVPTNRTVTRVLENLKDSGFIVKRKTNNKKVKAYYCLPPKLRIILEEKDSDLVKKKEIDSMLSRVKQIKGIIEQKK